MGKTYKDGMKLGYALSKVNHMRRNHIEADLHGGAARPYWLAEQQDEERRLRNMRRSAAIARKAMARHDYD